MSNIIQVFNHGGLINSNIFIILEILYECNFTHSKTQTYIKQQKKKKQRPGNKTTVPQTLIFEYHINLLINDIPYNLYIQLELLNIIYAAYLGLYSRGQSRKGKSDFSKCVLATNLEGTIYAARPSNVIVNHSYKEQRLQVICYTHERYPMNIGWPCLSIFTTYYYVTRLHLRGIISNK